MSSLNSIEISGNVKITNGNRVVSVGNNTICKSLIRHLMIWTYSNKIYAVGVPNYPNCWRRLMLPASGFNILFGKSNVPTNVLMTDLTTKIPCNPTTQTSNGWIILSDEIALRVTGTWSSGILNDYLSGEDALYEIGILCPLMDLVYSDNATPTLDDRDSRFGKTVTPPTGLLARYVLDSPGLVPDPAAPVLVQWEFKWRFV